MASELIINPESGILEKRTVVQGSISKAGYVRIRHNGKVEYVHRLIWEHVHGPIPKGMHIDHINGDKSDNRIANLRLATPTENAQNRHSTAGVSLCKTTGKWLAQIGNRGQRHFLGRFVDRADAEQAYATAAALLHTHNPKAKKETPESCEPRGSVKETSVKKLATAITSESIV